MSTAQSDSYPVLTLKPREERRLKQGHDWIFSNEIDTQSTPLTSVTAGEVVVIQASTGKPLGLAMVNPHSLICARLLTRNTRQRISQNFFEKRIRYALSLRERFFDQPYYRLIYGDSDGLSGLVVDRYGDVLVVQTNTQGMERARELVVAALDKVLQPTSILLKNDSSARQVEGMDEYIEDAKGTTPELVSLVENGTAFEAPVRQGQKTGWFYDHRLGRARLQSMVKGQRVLDLFSYIGGWGIEAATAGASEVWCVDSSEFALDLVDSNATGQGLSQVTTLQGNAFHACDELLADNRKFDVVVVDPPAFIKRKKDLNKGLQAYRKINEQAIRLLDDGGVLVSASCSMHLPRASLVDTVRAASRHVDRVAQVIEQTGQGPDHPVHPAIVETEYLKTLFARVGRW